ncbi:transposase [Streptomyces sp. NPDC005722]
MLSVVTDDGSTQSGTLIDEIVREGCRRMLAAALEAEVNQYIAEAAAETDGVGRRLVVRNGYHQVRTVVTAAGPVEVKAPRVNDRRVDEATGERKRFSSRILPPWCRKSPKISEVLPLLYLHGLSTGDCVPALEQFLGGAAGLSAATVTRMTKQWQDDHAAFQDRDELLAFYNFPAEHWIHLRTTNPIESAFSTVKLRTKVTRGAGSPAAALVMVFKLVESAQTRWRAITGAHLVPLVRAGAWFENGILVERQEQAA